MSVALGASSGRLARQALVESLLLGAVGVAAGLTVAWALVRTAQVLLPQAFVRASLNTIDLDLRALGAAAVVGLAATLLAGLVPVWLAGRVAGQSADALVKERSATGTRAARATSRVLLVTEVALACVLLAGASVLVRSFANVAGIDRGFDPTGLVTLTFSFDESGLTGREPRLAAAEEARRAIQALPGVTDTAWSAGQGIGFGPWTSDVPGSQPQRFEVQGTAVSPQYFGLHDITFQNGRAFDGRDGAHAAVVGDTIARRLWGDDVPLGRFIEWAGERHLIVGVVSEPRQSVVDSDLEYADLYVPFSGPGPYPTLSLRCADACPSEGLFRQVAGGLGSIGLWQVNYLDEELARDLEQPRAAAALVATFALVALLAAAGGLFGVISYSVLERRREFGIRSALGAAPGDISRVVYREGVLVGLIGLVTGGALAAAASSTLASLSYEASLADPTGLLVVGLTIALTIVAALWRPARTAARTDPAMLLREE